MLLAFLVACATTKSLPEGTEACPMDPCAAAASPSDARACCVEAHGYGVSDADDLERLGDTCAGGACDPATFVSADAALCIALAAGLEPGAEGCGASLWPSGTGSPHWLVESTLEAECPPGETYGDAKGVAMQVDAQTGEVAAATATTFSVIACDP